MCECIKSLNKHQFVQHNKYFLSWILVTKNDTPVKILKNKNVYIITGIDTATYERYKLEYKKHKALLKNIKDKLKEIKGL